MSWEIVATKSRALAFQLGVKQNAQMVFAKRVVHPALPQRAFMVPTLEESREQIIQERAAAVAAVLKEK